MVDLVPPQFLKHYRIYADDSGESHLDQKEVKQSLVNAAPPAPPFYVSAFNPASKYGFYSAPPEWTGNWHPAPAKQFMVLLSGALDVEVSDGDVVRLNPGDVLLVEDTMGKGHKSKNSGEGYCRFFVVQIPMG
jgi:mannose-6-phosphate isomerase-like protein (cupin superfamily)